MNNQLVVNEKYSLYWPGISIISAICSVLFFISYQLSGDVLLEGYLRLTSFGFFALAVLSFFKVKDGRMEITFLKNDSVLEIFYKVRNKLVHEEEIDLDKIEEIKTEQMPNKSIYNDFKKSDRCVRFKRKDSPNWIYLNEIHGRVIPLDQNNAADITQFVKQFMIK